MIKLTELGYLPGIEDVGAEDREELGKFYEFVARVRMGATARAAYSDTYGEVIFEAKEKP